MNPFENIPENTSNGYNSPSSMGSHDLQARLKMSMDRQLQGTNRCIASIHETESIGYAAAEELAEQGEKLDRAERNVDKIIQDTKQSQRHLNSIKSVFGGIKNWWSGSDKAPVQVEPSSRTSRPLNKVLETPRSNNTPHPLLNKHADTMGFYDEDVKDYNKFKLDEDLRPKQPQPSLKTAPPSLTHCSTAPPSSTQKSSRSQLWDDYEKGLESNLSGYKNEARNFRGFSPYNSPQFYSTNHAPFIRKRDMAYDIDDRNNRSFPSSYDNRNYGYNDEMYNTPYNNDDSMGNALYDPFSKTTPHDSMRNALYDPFLETTSYDSMDQHKWGNDSYSMDNKTYNFTNDSSYRSMNDTFNQSIDKGPNISSDSSHPTFSSFRFPFGMPGDNKPPPFFDPSNPPPFDPITRPNMKRMFSHAPLPFLPPLFVPPPFINPMNSNMPPPPFISNKYFQLYPQNIYSKKSIYGKNLKQKKPRPPPRENRESDPWFDDECKESKLVKRRLELKYIKTKKQEDFDKFTKQKQKYKQLTRMKKRVYLESLGFPPYKSKKDINNTSAASTSTTTTANTNIDSNVNVGSTNVSVMASSGTTTDAVTDHKAQMSSGLSNLKMLAEGMKNEIDTQNTQLDGITDKVDRSDAKVRNQNMQMKKILGK